MSMLKCKDFFAALQNIHIASHSSSRHDYQPYFIIDEHFEVNTILLNCELCSLHKLGDFIPTDCYERNSYDDALQSALCGL